MTIYPIILLRFVHIVAGILWAGAAISYLFFFKPSIKSIGPAGPQFMQTLTGRRKYPFFMISTSLLTVLAGGVLYWYSSGRLNPAWITSGPGIGYTLGSLAALVAFLVGNFGIGPTSAQLGELGGRLAASGEAPDPELLKQMGVLEKKLNLAENIDFIMLVVALVTMATARYWVF